MFFGFSSVGFSDLFFGFFVFVFLVFDLNLQYETKSNPKLTTPFLASLKSSMVFGNVFSSLKIACVHQTGKTPKLKEKPKRAPVPPQPQGLKEEDGFVPIPLTSAPSRGLGFRRVISIQSWFRKGHPGFATPSAMVVNCIQEQWSRSVLRCSVRPDSLQEKRWGFSLLAFPVGFLFFLHKFAQPSFTCAWSRAQHSTAGPKLAPLCQEIGKSWEAPGQAHPTTPGSLGRALPQHRANSPGGSWRALMAIHVCHQCPRPCCLFSSPAAHPKLTFSVLQPCPASSSPPSWHQCQHGD